MKIYCELTEADGCVGVLLKPPAELIYTGTELHMEDAKYRTLPLAVKLARECDMQFFFRDETVEKPFYTVPRTTVFARDSRGGWFVCGEDLRLNWSVPIWYIDAGFFCHRLEKRGETVADMGTSWRETMVPCDDIEVFRDRAAAQERYEIRSLQEVLERP